jgi:hypothetical protein
MDKLDLLNAPGSRLSLQVASERYDKQARLEAQRKDAAAEVTRENQRAASDTIEISAEALALLKSVKTGG